MTVKRIRSCVVTGCLLTTLALPAAAIVAPLRIMPAPDQGIGSYWELAIVPEGQAKASSTIEPWLRNTFVLIRADATRPIGPTVGAPSTEQPAEAEAALPEVQVPGTVQNLRCADRP